jgi:hypothetical protein
MMEFEAGFIQEDRDGYEKSRRGERSDEKRRNAGQDEARSVLPERSESNERTIPTILQNQDPEDTIP